MILKKKWKKPEKKFGGGIRKIFFYITLLFIFLACLPLISEGQVPVNCIIIRDMGNKQQDAMASIIPANVTSCIYYPIRPLS